MNLQRVSFSDTPEKITAEPYDCIWISFSGQSRRGPLTSPALQWLDWKLQGQISRFLLDSGEKAEKLTFIPTMKKLSAPYLALSSEPRPDWDLFARNCEGLKVKSVLYFCEDGDKMPEVERQIKERKFQAYPETVALGSDL